MGTFRIIALTEKGKKVIREAKTINTPVIKCVKTKIDPILLSFLCKMPIKYVIDMAKDIMNGDDCVEGIDYKIEVIIE